MITLRFQDPPAEATLSEAAILAYAGALIELAERKDGLPITVRLPGNRTWSLKIATAQEALGLAKFLIVGVKSVEAIRLRAERASQEWRRIAGASPISERTTMEVDERGELIGSRRTFRY